MRQNNMNYDELDPKDAVAYHNRGNAYQIKLKRVRNNNAKYMDMLKSSIQTVVPFLGAGASMPYGYDSWKNLLLKFLDMCCRVQELPFTHIFYKFVTFS
jgi:hypothetical protein